MALKDLLKARVRRLEEEHRRERVLRIQLVLPWGRIARSTSAPAPEPSFPESTMPAPNEQHVSASEVKWRHVRNPDAWNGQNGGFNQSNAKMVCRKCHKEFPFDLKCENCGSSKLVLDMVMETPGIFCSQCHEGQWHWDCPGCGRRQDFCASFFYNEKAIVLTSRLSA